MRKIYVLWITIIILTTLSNCRMTLPNVEDKEPNIEDNETKPTIQTSFGIDYIDYDNQLYDDFFDPQSVVEIKIDIEESELALIQSDYDYYHQIGSKSPIYRKSDVTIIVNGKTFFYEETGIRMKGNTSRTSFYNPDEGMYDMIHFKISFKETFDDELKYENPKVWTNPEDRALRKNRLFAGMEKLDLKWNRPKDETYTREYWTYEMFRFYDVMAPRITPVNLKLNYRGTFENFGIVYAIETVDEQFLEKRLASKHLGGDLYKVGWDHQYGGSLTLDTLDRIGVEDENKSYFPVYDLKTNKKNSDHQRMRNLILKLNSDEKVENLVNIDYYITFEAVSYLSGNPDDLRNHFNNYYIYFLKDTDLAVFIPYDYDRSFGINHDWNPTGHSMTKYSPYTHRTTMGEGNNQINPLILKTVARGSGQTKLIQDYRSLILDMIDSKFFDYDAFEKVYDMQRLKYEDLTDYSIDRLKDKGIRFNKHEMFNMAVKTYMQQKVATVNELIDSY